MITISSREFRENQKRYLDKVAQGTELLITRKNQAFKLIKVSEDDTLINKQDFFEQIEKAIADVKLGKTFAMKSNETFDDFIDRMQNEGHISY